MQPAIKNPIKTYTFSLFSRDYPKGHLYTSFRNTPSTQTELENETLSTQETLKCECVLCSENWQDFVVIYVPQLNDMPIDNNYANVSLKKIKNTYFQHSLMQEIMPEMIKMVQLLFVGPTLKFKLKFHSLKLAAIL